MTDTQDSDQFLDAFLAIERDLDLFAAREREIPFWEALRYPIYTRIISGAGLHDYYLAGRSSGAGQLLKNLSFVLRALTFNNPFFAGIVDLLILSGAKRVMQNGKQRDIYTDPLLEFVGDRYSFRVIERPFGETVHKTPPSHGPVAYLDFVYGLSAIRNKIFLPQLSAGTKSLCAEISARIEKICGVKLNVGEEVRKLVGRWQIELPLFEAMLRKIRPRALLVVVSAGNETLIAAAKKLAIPSAELQHGSPAPGKLNYDFPPGILKQNFPDYFLSFGPFWTRHVHLPLPAANVLTLGYPHMTQLHQRYAQVERRRQVLFLSQRTVGRQLAGFAIELRKETAPDVEIVYKLHPEEMGDWRQRYPGLEEAGIKVIADRGADLYALFAASTWQVGVYSTALYEGIAFGCRTFILDAPGWGAMRPLVEEGTAQLVGRASEVSLSSAGASPAALTKDYFAEVTGNKVISCIDTIISADRGR